MSYSQLTIFVLSVAQRGLVLSCLNTLYSVDGLLDVFKDTYYQALKEAEQSGRFDINRQKANGIKWPSSYGLNYYMSRYLDAALQEYEAQPEEDPSAQSRYISLLFLRVLHEKSMINMVLQMVNFIETGLGKDIVLIRTYLSQETNNLDQIQNIIENELEKFTSISEDGTDNKTFVRKHLIASKND